VPDELQEDMGPPAEGVGGHTPPPADEAGEEQGPPLESAAVPKEGEGAVVDKR
jgi:hypothetical protein